MRSVAYAGIEYTGLAQPQRVYHKVPRAVVYHPPKLPPHLRPQEEILLQHLACGYTVKEAAERMCLTWGTAKAYVDQARRRLHMRTTWQLIAAWAFGTVAQEKNK